MRWDRIERFIVACGGQSSDALRLHYRRLHERRERMVMGVIGEYQSVHGTGLRGALFDVTTDMVFAVSHALNERRRVAQWSMQSRAGRRIAA